MQLQTLSVIDSRSNNDLIPNRMQKLNEGVFLSKRLLIVAALIVGLVFLSVILGLVFGLKRNNKVLEETVSEKLVSCGDFLCSNRSYLDEITASCSRLSTVPVYTTKQPESKINYRLPTNLKPFAYEIQIGLDFDGSKEPDLFSGKVTVKFECLNKTNKIVLHSKLLDIDGKTLRLTSVNDTNLNISDLQWKYDNTTEFFITTLPQDLIENFHYLFYIEYTGLLKKDNVGFYKSSYKNGNNETRWLMASQMEPTDARKAFPCFDEPFFKAKFTISIIHHNNLNAMSNMPVVQTKKTKNIDLVETNFEESVEMSTYLLAVVVSDFECLFSPEKAGRDKTVNVSVCGRSNAKKQLEFSLEMSVKLLEFLETFYNISYPLTKCDHIAIPDFQAGAMENWGLVTYRESILFYDNLTSSDASKQSTVVVIAHELAHMWFGNLVSPEWWNDLWLNEGFASYVEFVATDHVQPSFKMFDQFLSSFVNILEADSVNTSHSISINVNEPNEINEIFDPISYGKGSLLVRMMNYFLGSDTFQKGITQYLLKYKFSNAKQDYLWEELDKQAKIDKRLENLDLKDIMNTWTKQMGHPVINIQVDNNNKMTISQTQFLFDPNSKPIEPSIYNYKWFVPFTYSIEKLGSKNDNSFDMTNLYNKTIWLKPSEEKKTIELGKSLQEGEFILANIDASSFYRVNYDAKTWDLIIKQLNTNKDAIPTSNRVQLINDAFGLSKANYIESLKPLEIIQYLSKETEFLPWNTAIARLSDIIGILDSTYAYNKFEKYILNLIKPVYDKLTWNTNENDMWLEKKLRTSIISFACSRNLKDCIDKSMQLYESWMLQVENNPIPPSYRSFVYCTAIRHGDDEKFHFAARQYEIEESASQKNLLQSAMSCTRQPWLLAKYLTNQLNTTIVREQDTLSGLSYAAVKAHGSLITWNFVKENWNTLCARYCSGLSISDLISAIASKLNTRTQLEDFERFFNQIENKGSAARAIETSKIQIKYNIKWLDENLIKIDNWLDTYFKPIEKPRLDYRLPTNLVPYHYDILIDVDFTESSDTKKNFTYKGSVKIQFKCVKDTKDLVIHINKLAIDNASLTLESSSDKDFSKINGFDWTNDFQREFLIANLSRTFRMDQSYTLSMSYTGYLTDDNAGFYRSSYLDNNGAKRWLMASQMEPTEARKAFPCFDEPQFKASFAISVQYPNDYKAISNMAPSSADYNYNGKLRTDFQTTPLMSTYLVALIVSDFDCINETSMTGGKGKVDIFACARPNAVESLGYSLKEAVKIQEFFEDYYQIKYPLDKCHHIALPDFSAGAMENWGAITYREARLLYTEGLTPEATEQSILSVISHEIAHQWFGNIVSPQWWSELWLNEGFARYMEYVGADNSKPNWQMLDAVSSSHPVSFEVNTPSEINEIFDAITYGKGGSAVRMVNYVLGSEIFKRGLTKYLDENKYGNAVQDNLWDALDTTAKLSGLLKDIELKKVMEGWTKQMGHPVVQLKQIDKTTLSISQNHFLIDPTSKPVESVYNYTWFIPFTYSLEKIGKKNPIVYNISNLFENITWLLPSQTELQIKLSAPLQEDDYILGNLDVLGFYRVNYESQNWDKIISQLEKDHTLIPVRTRAQLINDAFSFAQANYFNIERPFEIIKYLSKETEYLPWISAISRLSYVIDMIEFKPVYGLFEDYLIQLIKPVYTKLGWNENNKNDTWLDRKLRIEIVKLACALQLTDCVEISLNYFNSWFINEDNNLIPANFRQIVYCTAIYNGGKDEFEFLQEQYAKETDATHRNIIQSGMACVRNKWLIKKYLNMQFDETLVRRQDSLSGLRAAALREAASADTWEFVKENWGELIRRHTGLSFARLVADVTAKFNSEKQLNDFEIFFKININQGSAAREVKLSTERIKANIKFMDLNYNILVNWINLNTPSTETVKDVRLPRSLIPYLYELEIKPYIGIEDVYGQDSFTFDGKIKIHFECKVPTNVIIFHMKELTINSSSLVIQSSSDDLQISKEWTYDEKREFFKGKFNRQCKLNTNYTLSIEYKGLINDKLSGFYRSSYFDKNLNKTVYLATTHFQPTDARKAFPCFDEPDMKAEFQLTVIRHNTFKTSFGNMEHESFNVPISTSEWRRDVFAKLVPTSTYLIAFVISNFETISMNSTKTNVLVEVAARPQAISDGEGKFALNETAEIIDYFAEYFDTPYPLTKSTQIAVPDFNAGAMENWFGNLVTPEWWRDIWLNEGFASWVEYLGINHTHPEWRDLEYFYVQKLSTLEKDSLEASHPISVEVQNPNEINSIFDSISYNKGSSILRMMNAFLTEKTFKIGVANYLKKFAFKNAKQDDLWEELTKQAYLDKQLDNVTVKQIMDTWTLQKGYPIVTINRIDVNGTQKLQITQNWFLLNPNVQNGMLNKQKWFIPFTYTTNKEANFSFESKTTWLQPSKKEVQIDSNLLETDWLIGNIQHAGFYRVNYDESNWRLLEIQLNNDLNKINPINRATLIDDSFNLGRANVISSNVFLDIIKYLKNEDDPIPWTAAFYGIRYFGNMLETLDCKKWDFNIYRNFTVKLLEKNYQVLAWNTSIDDANLIELQVQTMAFMCSYGYRDCIEKSKALYNEWNLNGTMISPNFKNIVLRTAIRYGDRSDWDSLFEKVKNTQYTSESLIMFRALASTQDFNTLEFFLSQTSNENIIKSQDETSVLSAISANPIGRTIAWEYLKNNWDNLLNRYNEVSFTLSNLVLSLLGDFNTNSQLKDIESFMKKSRYLGVAKSSFIESIEKIKINIFWMENKSNDVQKWLELQQY